MNMVPAMGSPGSLIRRIQENPQIGVDLLAACKAMLDDLSKCTMDGARVRRCELARAAIVKAEATP